jgi:hypothetical protein
VAEHIDDDAAIVLFAVVPARALGGDVVALEHPIAELASDAEDFSEESLLFQALDFSHASEPEFVLDDAVFHSGLRGGLEEIQGVGGSDGGRLLAIDTLAGRIEARRSAPAWFSSREILDAFLPIARVVAEMNAGGVVHRDIKPANILFVGGRPCLADIGLLDDDRASLTARGTPGHLPPSWYLEASGQPDMWGLATTLYTLLTGNHPDKIGRANFRWPPQGEASMAPEERQTWERWHAAILRATEEIAHERFLTIESFADACRSGSNAGEISKPGGLPHKRFGILAGISILLLGAAAWLFYWGSQNRNREQSSQSGEGVRVQHVVIQPKEEAPYSPQQSSQHQIVEVPAPEIDFSALADGMKGSVNSVEELGVRTEKLRQNETHPTERK